MSNRRLPAYLALDTSGSMRGEPIAAVNVGLHALLASLRQNPFALESVSLAVVTFDRDVRDVLPLPPLDQASDTQAFEKAIPRVKAAQFAPIVACAAGPKSVPDQLKRLTDKVVSMDSSGFASFFQWVSAAVTAGSASVGAAGMALPPPAEINLLL